MLSGIGPESHLKKMNIDLLADLPVGNGYSNHACAFITATIKNSSLISESANILSFSQLKELYIDKSGPLIEFTTLYYYLSSNANRIKEWPNLYIFSLVLPLIDIIDQPMLAMIPTLARVKSRGTIRLTSNDPLEYPLIDPQFLTHPQDFEDFMDAIKQTFFILEETPFSKYVELSSLPVPGCSFCKDLPKYKCDSYIKCLIRQTAATQYHPSGSCRMGDIEYNTTVVDENCRVKNVKQLRVIDSSIFPEPVNANTNAVAIMAGEKCAQSIRDEK